MRRFSRSAAGALSFALLVLAKPVGGQDLAQGGAAPAVLLVPVGAALVDASDGSWAEAQRHLGVFESQWLAQQPKGMDAAQQVAASLGAATRAVEKAANASTGATVPDAKTTTDARAALSRLAQAVDIYVQAVSPAGPARADEGRVESLNANVTRSLESLKRGDPTGAAAFLQVAAQEWLRVENGFRATNTAAYAKFEIASSHARAALLANPPDIRLAEQSLDSMLAAIAAYRSGTAGAVQAGAVPSGAVPSGADAAVPSTSGRGLAELLSLLRRADDELAKGNRAAASASLQDFVELWPLAEGEVRTRSAAVYAEVENQTMQVSALLLSTDPASADRAREVLRSMIGHLVQVGGKTGYTAWDAAVILFREGMEALLVLVALLAMLRKSERSGQVGWVWAGAGTGIAFSGILALILVLALTGAAAGPAREAVEGFVGLASVALMLSVGAWLHRRSSLQAWNAFIKKTVGGALARGSMWSIFALACLAVLREGAESVVFYIGIAPGISLAALAGGIGGALVGLAVIGYLLIRYSVRLPLHWFFLAATILIYSLAFKITGESLHALQVAGTVPARYHDGLPSLGLLGVYPTWETFLPQLLVLCLVLAAVLSTELHRIRTKKRQTA